MANLNAALNDDDEAFVDRSDGLDWVDDVSGYQCTRCQKVLVEHFIANCEHKFCSNCKRVVDDGSQRWRCPDCRHFITDIGRQDPGFKDAAMQLRLHCPNRKYGCQHICPFKDIKKHLERCEDTKERALPVLYRGGLTVEMLEQMFSRQNLQLRKEMKEMRERMMALEERNAHFYTDEERKGGNESVRELSVRADEMQRVMLEMEKRQKDGEERVLNLNEWVDRVQTDFNAEAARLKNEISVLREKAMRSESSKAISLAVEESKSKISKLEGKTDTWIEFMQSNNRKNNELMNQLKNKVENELKTKENKIQSEMETFELTINEMAVAQEKKWAEQVTKWAEQKTKWVVNERKWAKQETKWVATDRKWAEIEDSFNKRTLQLEMEMRQMTSQLSAEMSTLKEKLKETEETMRVIEVQGVYNSLIKPKFQHLRRVSEYYKAEPDFTLSQNMQGLITGSEEELLSEVFPLRGYPFSAQVKMITISLAPNDIFFEVSFKDTKQKNQPIAIKPMPNIFLTVKDQSNNKEPKNIIKISHTYNMNYSFKYKLQYNHFYVVGKINKSLLKSAPYNVNDQAKIGFHVETPEVAQSVYSRDGTLTWAIDDFQKRKQMEVDGLIECQLSPYFYSSPKGYRMQVEACLNGFGAYENKGVSIWIKCLDGVYDEDLEDSFARKTTVTIFHPTQPHTNISKSKEYNSLIYSEWFNMGSEAEIENFLHNDTLYYKVAIEVIKQ